VVWQELDRFPGTFFVSSAWAYQQKRGAMSGRIKCEERTKYVVVMNNTIVQVVRNQAPDDEHPK